MKINFFVFFLSLLFYQNCSASYWNNYKAHRAYQAGDYKKVVDILRREQIENPNDPLLNYNLGTARYQISDFSQAKADLERCIENCDENQIDLKEKALFNLGNSFYKNGLEILGKDWENQSLDEKLLNQAIEEVKNSVDKFKNALVLNTENKRTETNKKKVEDLLNKLEEKKKQQEKQKQQKEQNEKNDQKKDQDKKQDNEQQEDQDKQNENSRQKDSADKKDKNDGSDQQQNGQQDKSRDGKNDRQNRQNQDLENEEKDKKEQDMNKHDKESPGEEKEQQEPTKKNGTKEELENQDSQKQQDAASAKKGEQGVQQNQDLKSKGIKVILDKLENEEAELQKRVIFQKTKGARPRLDKGQKPW